MILNNEYLFIFQYGTLFKEKQRLILDTLNTKLFSKNLERKNLCSQFSIIR